MKEKIAAGIAIILAVVADGWYCWHIVIGSISPALATWLIFAVATTVSLLSYLKHNETKRKPFVANLANRLDPVVVWLVVAFILFAPKGDAQLGKFDIGCLAASAAILILWAATHSAIAANLLIQLVMVAAYMPTFFRLFSARRNTESFVTWGLTLAVASLFLVPTLRHRDWLAVAYVGRAIGCVMAIIAAMIYFQYIGPR